MAKGALIFVNDTSFIYSVMADANSYLIRKYLDLPTTIIDSTPDNNYSFQFAHNIIKIDIDQKNRRLYKSKSSAEEIIWANIGRTLSYDLTPYDETLVIDADYFIFSNNLKLAMSGDFKIFSQSYDVTGRNSFQSDSYLSKYFYIRMLWATAFYFRKCDETKKLFDFCKHVEQNYDIFSAILGFKSAPLRNDKIFSIANHVLNAYLPYQSNTIPWPILTLPSDTDITFITENEFVYSFCQDSQTTVINKMRLDQDIHIMNKHSAEKLSKFILSSI